MGQKLKPPVFIVGSPRSGTTWLYHILLSSGGFAIYRTEAKVFTHLAPLYGGFRSRLHRERFLERWLQSEDFLRSGLEPEYVRKRILNDCSSTADCQRILMDSIAEQQGAARWSDTTPDNLLYIDEIARSFPDALFIHMVRDGRDVALSMARQHWIRPLPWDKGQGLLPAALYWDWAVGRGRSSGLRLGSRRYIEVHYRDLVQHHQETLDRISKFISHDLDAARIQRTAIGSVSKPNTSFVDKPGANFQPVDRWRSSCSDSELRLMEWVIGRRLSELGYELLTPPGKLTGSRWERLNRLLYHANFALRFWVKNRTVLGRWLADTSLIEAATDQDLSDRTLRPSLHIDFIRSCVAGR